MINKRLYDKYAAVPAAFRDDLVIEVDGTAKLLGSVSDKWQKKDFAALDAGLLKCVGRAEADARLRAYLERPRGHSKTTDIAITCVWLLTFATRPLKGYSYAADRDQAALLRDAIDSLVRLNPWLSEILTVDKDKVANVASNHPGSNSVLKIETSDVASSYGILPDFIVADEFTHWQGDGSLWNSLISSAAKKANCLLLGISNAGFVDSWQWRIRGIIRTDEDWYFSRLEGPQASWLTEKRLEEQRRLLPTVAYNRLWLNEWSSGGGDALTTEDINAAFDDILQPMNGGESNWTFVAGVDLGLKRDCSAVVTLAIGRSGTSNQGRIRLAENKLWKPTKGSKINLMEVEKYLRQLNVRFHLRAVAFDPWQAEHLAQRLEFERTARHEVRGLRSRSWMREVPPTGSNLRDIASLVIESFTDRRIRLYPCEELRTDLHKLRIEEKSYGYRLSSPRDENGHGDTFSAFALALYIGHEVAGRKPKVIGPMFSSEPTFQELARRYAEEQAMFSVPDDDEPFRELMKAFGRTK